MVLAAMILALLGLLCPTWSACRGFWNQRRSRSWANSRVEQSLQLGAGQVSPYFGAIPSLCLSSCLKKLQNPSCKKCFDFPKLLNSSPPIFRSEALWEALLDFTSAKCIVDLTAGGGTLAKVAMRRGTPYVGVTKNKSHATWLGNVIDLFAIRCLSQTSHPLYQQSLHDLLTEHFHEELKPPADQADLTPEEVLALQGEADPHAAP